MGWSTNLFCEINFNRETFNSEVEVTDKINEIKGCLEVAKKRLQSLIVMTEPNKFCPKDSDPIGWLEHEFSENMELIEEYIVDLYKLELLYDNWHNCHNEEGLAIDPPENIGYDTAFLDGDFVRSVKYPNTYE